MGRTGTGSPAHGLLPEIPDFTKGSWQVQRSDTQLIATILDGKGSAMPPGGDDMGEEQARGLVASVRAFVSATGESNQEEQEAPPLAVTLGHSKQG
jgi:hypothetical protein